MLQRAVHATLEQNLHVAMEDALLLSGFVTTMTIVVNS